MALESQILMSNFGISEEFADRLIKFTKGDVEGAIKLINSSEQDILVVKAKFISSKKMLYGAIILFYNFQMNLPEYILCVITTDLNLSKIKIENDWQEFIDNLISFYYKNESDPDISSRIESQIVSSDNINYLKTFFSDRNNIDVLNLKRFYLSEISKIVLDSTIVLKLATQNIDLFHFRNFSQSTKIGMKLIPKTMNQGLVILNLKVEPILAPINGVDVENIKVNDEILVKVIDSREIVSYIISLITGGNEQSNYNIYGKVISNQKSTETANNILQLEFGPGIIGSLVIGSKIKVEVKQPEQKKETKTEKIEEKQINVQNKNNYIDNIKTTDDSSKSKIQDNKINLFLYIVIGLIFFLVILFFIYSLILG